MKPARADLPLSLIGALFVGALVIMHVVWPSRSLDYVGPFAILDSIYAFGWLAVILLVGLALGLKLMRLARWTALTTLEQGVFGLALGLGGLAYGVFLLGLIGWLQAWTLVGGLILLAALTRHDWCAILRAVPQGWGSLRSNWQAAQLGYKALALVIATLLAMTVIHALTPPWDYDGLMYHLQAPRLYLQAGRLLVLPDLWQANSPNLPDMVYVLSLALGSDILPKLLHVAYGMLLTAGLYALGRRVFSAQIAGLAVVFLLSLPIVWAWASWAYTDMAVATYEFLALYAVVIWLSDHQAARWLALAAVITGLAISSKLLALSAAGILGLWIVWASRRQPLRVVAARALGYGGVALLIVAPWYLRNWLQTGNPVYPLVLGGPGWDAARLNLIMAYLGSFGTGHGLLDYALLPVNLLARRMSYAAFWGEIEFVSPVFSLAFLYPVVVRPRHTLGLGLATVAMARFGAWALGSQQARFLLPAFPLFSLLAAAVVVEMLQRLRLRQRRLVTTSLLSGLLIVALAGSVILWVAVQPLNVVIGAESTASFLSRQVGVYPAQQYIQTQLHANERALLMWNGLGYYCDERCVPDPEQSRWTYLTQDEPNVAAVAAKLRSLGITHLVYSLSDVEFFLRHDPMLVHRAAVQFFLRDFQPACTRAVFESQWTIVYELTCS